MTCVWFPDWTIQRRLSTGAIGKAPGAWRLSPDADEATRGFLLNHLISDELPVAGSDRRLSNSDPITGQAGWYDVRVRIAPARAEEPATASPAFDGVPALPGTQAVIPKWLAYVAGTGLPR